MKNTPASIISTLHGNTISISTYLLSHPSTQSESDQPSQFSIHHIHIAWQHNIHLYLPPISPIHTERVKSNKPVQHPSHPHCMATQYPSLLTVYSTHPHRTSQVRQASSASIISILHGKHNIHLYLRPITPIHTE